MMDRRWLVPLLLGCALTLALLLGLSIHDARQLEAMVPNPAPTLMPTPPIVIPAGADVQTALDFAREERAGNTTITITNNTTIVDTDVCVALICPPRP